MISRAPLSQFSQLPGDEHPPHLQRDGILGWLIYQLVGTVIEASTIAIGAGN